MTNGCKLVLVSCVLAACGLPVFGQVQPVPLPGGDSIPPYGLFNQFFPGVGSIYDGPNADPHGITNFRGSVAMGYTVGPATDGMGNKYTVITDIRVYQGDYIGAVGTYGGGGTTSAKAHGTFVEIWIDLWDVGLTTQLHDFNPGITPNGVFWIVQVPDSAVQITEDSISINLQNVAVVDQGHFPGGTGTAPVTLSFQATYVKTGAPRVIRPATHDPLSPFNWAGKMWMATNSGSFSVAYNDGSFTAQGTFSSSGNFGELGRERNGVFAQNHDNDDAEDTNAVFVVPSKIEPKDAETSTRPAMEAGVWSRPILKGRLPLKGLDQFVPVN